MNAYDGDTDDLPLPDMPPAPPKEPTVAYSAPEYRFAGANMGAEPVMECGQCGALLREGNTFLHSHWHERVQNMSVRF
jgi:hypothetical protein